MIIGICGFIGSGKDTIADYLVNIHGFRRESFANSLKDAVSKIFNWDRILLEGRTKEAREWREKVDPWWSKKLEMPNLTPRWVLQYWGTEVARKAFHDSIWIASLENKLLSSKDNIVISDCRFPNEITSIQNAGGKIFWVKRGNLPVWYDTAVRANANNEADYNWMASNVHSSEWAWIGTKFDAEIDNNKSFEDLFGQVENLIKNLV